MTSPHRSRRGSALIEFTLVGIPILFTIVSVFEISRGMWLYATLAHCVREATRYAIVHGSTCSGGQPVCASRISDIANRIQHAGVGLAADQLVVTMSSATRTVGPQKLSELLTNTAYFPASAPGTQPQDSGAEPGQWVTITARYPFASAICMVWPGTGTSSFATVDLPAASQARIEF